VFASKKQPIYTTFGPHLLCMPASTCSNMFSQVTWLTMFCQDSRIQRLSLNLSLFINDSLRPFCSYISHSFIFKWKWCNCVKSFFHTCNCYYHRSVCDNVERVLKADLRQILNNLFYSQCSKKLDHFSKKESFFDFFQNCSAFKNCKHEKSCY
jgi:hypothetical protein